MHESFVHLPLSLFEASLAGELRFHICHLQILRNVSHESFFSHLPFSLFEESLAQKLRFHIFHFHFLREISHEMRFGEIADGEACPVDGFETRSFQPGSFPDRPRSGTVLQLNLSRWHCGCVKVAYCRGCVRNAIVFCSWTL